MKTTILAMSIVTLFIALAVTGCSNQPPPKTEKKTPPVTIEIAIEGNQAPNFTLTTLDGRTFSLNDFRGRVVVLHFWGIACPSCVEEISHFQAVSDKWATEEVVVLAVHVRGTNQAIQRTVDKLGLTLPILLDSDNKVCDIYGHGYPTTFFIDRNGIIKLIFYELFQNPDEINSIITSLVSEPNT